MTATSEIVTAIVGSGGVLTIVGDGAPCEHRADQRSAVLPAAGDLGSHHRGRGAGRCRSRHPACIHAVVDRDAVGPGILPASMLSLIEMLPVEQQFSTKIILTGATSFERSHPLTPVLGGMFGMDDLALDDLWQAAGLL